MIHLFKDDSHIAWVNLMHFKATEYIQGAKNLWHLKYFINLLEFQIPDPGQTHFFSAKTMLMPNSEFWWKITVFDIHKNKVVRT